MIRATRIVALVRGKLVSSRDLTLAENGLCFSVIKRLPVPKAEQGATPLHVLALNDCSAVLSRSGNTSGLLRHPSPIFARTL